MYVDFRRSLNVTPEIMLCCPMQRVCELKEILILGFKNVICTHIFGTIVINRKKMVWLEV